MFRRLAVITVTVLAAVAPVHAMAATAPATTATPDSACIICWI